MTKYISRFPKRFPSRWESLLEFRRQQAGLYTPEEFKSIIRKINEKRKKKEEDHK